MSQPEEVPISNNNNNNNSPKSEEVSYIEKHIQKVRELRFTVEEQVKMQDAFIEKLDARRLEQAKALKEIERLKKIFEDEYKIIKSLVVKPPVTPYDSKQIAGNVNYIESILGYRNCRYESDINTDELVIISMEYNEFCYVKISRDKSWHYRLIQISPEHPSGEELGNRLDQNQDLKGFLNTLLKYFSFVTNLKDENIKAEPKVEPKVDPKVEPTVEPITEPEVEAKVDSS